MSGHQHDHGAGHGSTATPAARRRALVLALAANAGLLVVQLVTAIAFGSLALFADSAHLATDVVALGLAFVALRLSARPASARTTYGWERTEVLAAMVNAAMLVAASVWIAVEAVDRFSHPGHIDGTGVAIVGALGLVVNAGSAWLVARVSGQNLNLRGAFLHLASDALGSLGVLASGIVIASTGADWIDPAISLAITVLVLAATWSLVRDATAVLMEQAPRGLDADARVEAVHHLHLWSLGAETPALSAHVVLAGEPTLHAAQLVGNDLRAALEHDFGIDHATIELECHDCADQVHTVAGSAPRDSHP